MVRKIAVALFTTALLAASAVGFAQETTKNYGQYSITFADFTDFGTDFYDDSSTGLVKFGWTIPDAVSVTGGNPAVLEQFLLPLFQVTAAPGYVFSGPVTGFIGNLVYAEFGNGLTRAGVDVNLMFDDGPLRNFTQPLDKTATSPVMGYYSGSASLAHPGAFNSLIFAGSLGLWARGASGIGAQPQNVFEFSLMAAPVPEPESLAMLMAGLGVVGAAVWRRRRGHD